MRAYLVENGRPVKRLRPVHVNEELKKLDFISFQIRKSNRVDYIGGGAMPNDDVEEKLTIPVITIKWVITGGMKNEYWLLKAKNLEIQSGDLLC